MSYLPRRLCDIFKACDEPITLIKLSRATSNMVVQELKGIKSTELPKGATLSVDGKLRKLCGANIKIDSSVTYGEAEFQSANYELTLDISC